MEGGRPSSVALLFLTLALAAGSLAAVAQLPPPADQRYVLMAVRASEEIQMRVALRTGDDVALPGFANRRTNHWFAVTGSESLIQQGAGLLLPAYHRRNIPGQGMGNLLRVLVNNNGTQQ
ncbi:unnamed protein product [Urochloa decumbens]|uniref:Uncharacterized protein n=1 Tax=Urochloa decumbens TaxID=240449 RepID=A0ABC9D9M1_9POAL